MEEIDLMTQKPDIRKVLLIGQEGSGKTNFIGTMPKPIYVFSTDKGYLTLAGIPGIKVGLCMDEDRYKPHAFSDFRLKFEELKRGLKYKWPDGREEPFKTIAIDSISFLSNFIFDHEQRISNNIDKPGGFAVYGTVRSRIMDILNSAVMIAEYVCCTALVAPSKDDTTGEIFFSPVMVGSIKDEIGAWFDAVLFLQVDKDVLKGTKAYKMLTVGDRRQKAKIRLPSNIANVLLSVEEPNFEKLMEKISKASNQQTK